MFQDVLSSLWAERYFLTGVLAGVLSILAFIPYIRDTLRGDTRPDRACWLIWAVLASISGATHLSAGAYSSLFYISVQVCATVLIFALSILKGHGGFFRRGNVMSLSLAGIGLVSWAMMDTAFYALVLSIAISAVGGVRTVIKSYREPGSETALTWALLVGSAGLGVVSVGAMDALLLAYPVYLFVLYSAIVLALVLGRAARARAADEWAWQSRRLIVPPVMREPRPLHRAAAWPVRPRRRFSLRVYDGDRRHLRLRY